MPRCLPLPQNTAFGGGPKTRHTSLFCAAEQPQPSTEGAIASTDEAAAEGGGGEGGLTRKERRRANRTQRNRK
eukprot:2156491-Rhodomonas_salina.1